MEKTEGRLYTFQNRKIGKATFASATYDPDENVVVGYAFVRHGADLDALFSQLRAAIRPNAFVDEMRIVSDSWELARAARAQLERLAADDVGLRNVGLYMLNPDTGDFDELVAPEPNADFWYRTYVKPVETRLLREDAQQAARLTLPLGDDEQAPGPHAAARQDGASPTLPVPTAPAVRARDPESLIDILDDYDKHLIDTTEIFRKFVADSAQSLERETKELEDALAQLRESERAKDGSGRPGDGAREGSRRAALSPIDYYRHLDDLTRELKNAAPAAKKREGK